MIGPGHFSFSESFLNEVCSDMLFSEILASLFALEPNANVFFHLSL